MNPIDSRSSESFTPDDYASLTSEAGEYMFENGRRYHGYKAGKYMVPNDEHEMDREDMKHHIVLLLTEGRLHLAPINPKAERILDIGTGTGIWAIDMADAYPNATIIATDLSPIQPVWVPPNMIIEIDDVEDDWLYKPESMDYIHARFLCFAIRNWSRFLNQSMKALKPGAWVELVEMNGLPHSPDGTLPEKPQLMELYKILKQLGASLGMELDAAPRFKGMLEAAGFEDVQETVFELPLGPWSKDKRMNEVGRFQNFQLYGGLSSIAMAMMTRVGGWTPERVEVFLAGVRREGYDRKIHMCFRLYFVSGRKPMSNERYTEQQLTPSSRPISIWAFQISSEMVSIFNRPASWESERDHERWAGRVEWETEELEPEDNLRRTSEEQAFKTQTKLP